MITRALVKWRQKREVDVTTDLGSESERFEDVMLLALNVEEGATSRGIWAATRSWKRQGNRFSQRLQRVQPRLHLDFTPVNPCRTSASRTLR